MFIYMMKHTHIVMSQDGSSLESIYFVSDMSLSSEI